MSEIKGFVWMNCEGKYLRVSERATHTGRHIDVDFDSDINKASVMGELDQKLVYQHPEVMKLIRLRATCEVIRTVRLDE
jgi:hypothetical protein